MYENILGVHFLLKSEADYQENILAPNMNRHRLCVIGCMKFENYEVIEGIRVRHDSKVKSLYN